LRSVSRRFRFSAWRSRVTGELLFEIGQRSRGVNSTTIFFPLNRKARII
jgi:hypothetical protein